MIVDDLNLISSTSREGENDAPLFINSDRVEIFQITLQIVEIVTGRDSKISQHRCRINITQTLQSLNLHIPMERTHKLLVVDFLCVFVAERPYHGLIIPLLGYEANDNPLFRVFIFAAAQD